MSKATSHSGNEHVPPRPSRRRRPLVELPGPWPVLDVDEAVRLYTEEGLRAYEIAAKLGFRSETVQVALRKRGVPPHATTGELGPHSPSLYRRWKSIRRKARLQGVRFFPGWSSFKTFYGWSLKNGYQPELMLTRRDPHGDYSPANCRWWPRARISKRALASSELLHPPLTAFGETKSIAAWQRDPRCKVRGWRLRARLAAGFGPELAMTAKSLKGAGWGKLARPAYVTRKLTPRNKFDWQEVERRWRQNPTSFAELARSIGAHKLLVLKHLAHLREEWRELRRPPLPRKQMERLPAAWRRMRERGHLTKAGWRSYEEFREWSLSAGFGAGKRLQRIDNRQPFTPSNCRWTVRPGAHRAPKFDTVPTRRERSRIEAFGEIRGLTAWSRDRRCQVSLTTLRDRLLKGWAPELAITTPCAPSLGGIQPKLVTAFGERKPVSQWALDERCAVCESSLRLRLRTGMDPEAAIATPAHQLDPLGLGPDGLPRTPPASRPSPGRSSPGTRRRSRG